MSLLARAKFGQMKSPRRAASWHGSGDGDIGVHVCAIPGGLQAREVMAAQRAFLLFLSYGR